MSIYLLMGNEALGIGAVHAGVNFAAGYPGTPSTEVLETIARKNDGSIHVEWSTNEKVALEAGIGAAMAGARSLVTMKQVGLNVAADPLMTASYLGCKGALVLVVADDPGPISSQTEQDTRAFGRFAKVPVLDPVSAGECYGLIQDAFEISEKYQTPVIVRPTTRVCHACGTVKTRGGTADCAPIETFKHPKLEDNDPYWEQFAHVVSGFERDVSRWVVFPKTSRANHAKIEVRAKQIADNYACDWHPNRIEMGNMSHIAGVKAFEQAFNCGGVCGDTAVNGTGAMSSSENTALDSENPASSSENALVGSEGAVQAGAHGAFAEENKLFELGIACGGISYHYVKEALEMLGASERTEADMESASGVPAKTTSSTNIPVFKVGMPYPFPEQLGCKLLKCCKKVLVVEELDPVIERELLFLCGKEQIACKIMGKLDGHFAYEGEQSVEAIISQLKSLGVACAENSSSTDSSVGNTAGYARNDSSTLGTATYAESEAGGIKNRTDGVLEPAPELPSRPPVLCAGCPHRASFYAVKQAVLNATATENEEKDMAKHKAVFCGDIGCYTLGNAAPLEMVDTCVCMGAGLSIPQGIKVAENMAANNVNASSSSTGIENNGASVDNSTANINGGDTSIENDAANTNNSDNSSVAKNSSSNTLCFGFSGDSTFFASGIPAVVNALYNQHDIIICILDNSITAMTGQQPHPGTGKTLMNTQSEPLSIHRILDALGVPNTTLNPFNQKQTRQAVQNAISMVGVRAIIFKAPCIYLDKSKKHALCVDVEKCNNCYRCIDELGCPAIHIENRQVQITTSLCTGCSLCAQVCPEKAIRTQKIKNEGADDADNASAVKSTDDTEDADNARSTDIKDTKDANTSADQRGQHE